MYTYGLRARRSYTQIFKYRRAGSEGKGRSEKGEEKKTTAGVRGDKKPK